MSPYEVIYSQNPPLVAPYLVGISNVQEVDHTDNTRVAILSTLKDNLDLAQNKIVAGISSSPMGYGITIIKY